MSHAFNDGMGILREKVPDPARSKIEVSVQNDWKKQYLYCLYNHVITGTVHCTVEEHK